MEYHRLEKSLAMAVRRAGAGQDAVVRLVAAVEEYVARFGWCWEIGNAIKILRVYRSENCFDSLNSETRSALGRADAIGCLHAAAVCEGAGGYKALTAEELDRDRSMGGEAFLRSRHSIRDFTPTRVSREEVKRIAGLAMTAPSVCNRQEWRLYAIDDRQLIGQCLQYQNGNRGFGERIPLLFVVAVDLTKFVSVQERNQGWVDGGIFAMNLMLAIHACGMGSCPLNWCASRASDLALRELLRIPRHEIIVVLIAAGYVPDVTRIAWSPRKDVAEVLAFREANAAC